MSLFAYYMAMSTHATHRPKADSKQKTPKELPEAHVENTVQRRAREERAVKE